MTSWGDTILALEVLIVNLGGSVRLFPLLLKSVTTFSITWSSGIDVFSSHQQSNVEKCETVFKNLIEIYVYKWR